MSSKKLLIAVLAAGAVIVAGAVTYALWPTETDCGAEIARYAEKEGVSQECVDRLDRGAEKIEDQATAISACHDAIEAEHARAWTVALTFDSTSIDEELGEFAVSGGAHFTTGNGNRLDREYTCAVVVEEGKPDVLTAVLS